MFATSITDHTNLTVGAFTKTASWSELLWAFASAIVAETDSRWEIVTGSAPTPANLQSYAGDITGATTTDVTNASVVLYDTLDPYLSETEAIARMVRLSIAHTTYGCVATVIDPVTAGADWSIQSGSVASYYAYRIFDYTNGGYYHYIIDDHNIGFINNDVTSIVKYSHHLEVFDEPTDGHWSRADGMPSISFTTHGLNNGSNHFGASAFPVSTVRNPASALTDAFIYNPNYNNVITSVGANGEEILIPGITTFVPANAFFGFNTLLRATRNGAITEGGTVVASGRRYLSIKNDGYFCRLFAIEPPV